MRHSRVAAGRRPSGAACSRMAVVVTVRNSTRLKRSFSIGYAAAPSTGFHAAPSHHSTDHDAGSAHQPPFPPDQECLNERYASKMMTNRSVPADTVLPHIVYEDVREALAWLSTAFGFREHYRYGPPDAPSGAQMRLERAVVMLRTARQNSGTPARLGYWTQSLTVFVDDVEAHFERAKAAGAKIVEELHETSYGELQYGVEDFAGHHWLFSRHARDLDPADWGATPA